MSLVNIFATSVYLTLPLIIAGVWHMIAVKKNRFRWAAVPISRSLFGANKTWRGFLVMPPAGLVGVYVVSQLDGVWGNLLLRFSDEPRWLLGLCLGFAYVAFELPNSFIKRRMGVAPGKVPSSNRWFYLTLDHIDSLTGCVLTYLLFFGYHPSIIAIVVIGPAIHFAVNFLLWLLGLRKEKF